MVVEISADRERLVVRVRGQNRAYAVTDLPANLAAALAERWQAEGDMDSKALVGAFLAIDARGDAKRGRRLLDEADACGSAVAHAVLEQLNR